MAWASFSLIAGPPSGGDKMNEKSGTCQLIAEGTSLLGAEPFGSLWASPCPRAAGEGRTQVATLGLMALWLSLFLSWGPNVLILWSLVEISPECSLEELMLKLKLQYFGHLMPRVDSLEKTLKLGKAGGEGDDRGWDGWMASPTQWTWVWVNSGSWWWTGRPGVLQPMGSQRAGHDWATALNWTVLLFIYLLVAVLGLCCGAGTSHCRDSFVCEAPSLGHVGSSRRGPRAQLLHGAWNLPGPGIEPMAPALAGRFLSRYC